MSSIIGAIVSPPPISGTVNPLASQESPSHFLQAEPHNAPRLSSDDELIEQILSGNENAYEQLFQRHIRRVITIAWHFFRTKETVEDITQETFSKAYFSLSNYHRGASFGQWLAKIAVNNCYDELRRRKKRSEMLVTDITQDETAWLESKLAANSYANFFGSSDKQNASEIIFKLLSKLTNEDRLVLTLLHAHDYSVKEIAQLLDWSEAKVKIRAFRARHHLRKIFKQITLAEQRTHQIGHTIGG